MIYKLKAFASSLTWRFTVALPLNPYMLLGPMRGVMSPLPSFSKIDIPNVPVTAKLLEIPREGYTALYETEMKVPKSKNVNFERSIIIINIS